MGWSSAPSETAKKYIDEKYWDLPSMENSMITQRILTGKPLWPAPPDVIIDVGEWDEDYKADLDTLQEQIGIPVILVEANLEQNPSAYRTIGELLGIQSVVKLWLPTEDVLKDAKEKAASIPENERKRVYYGEGGNRFINNPERHDPFTDL